MATPEQVDAARETIMAALREIPPTDEQPGWLSEWVLVAAWVDDEGDTWMTRLASHDKLAHYRIEGLLRSAETTAWSIEAALSPEDD